MGCTMLWTSQKSMASQPLSFGYETNAIESLMLSNVLGETFQQTYIIAKIDLNEDGLGEFIARTRDCGAPQHNTDFCDFSIIAMQADQTLEIGSFKAKAAKLSNNYFKGIRDLHVYNIQKNDYSYNILRWNPEKSEYRLLTNGS